MKTTSRKLLQRVGMGLLASGVAFAAHAQSQGAGSSRSSVVTQVKPGDAMSGTVPLAPTAGSSAAGSVAQTAPAASAAGASAAPNSTVSELQGLIQSRALNELRTTYNGNYGASLLFKSDDLQYYVAMFQQKNFWRVVKTSSDTQAEQLYKAFVDQTVQLAEVDLRRIKLDAEKAFTEKLISSNEGRLNALQNDLTVQRQQEQEVAARQEQARQQAAALTQDRQAARDQLITLQKQIRTLEDQQAKLDPVGKITGGSTGDAPARRR